MTEKMKEVLLYCLAEEYAFYPEDYSKRTIRALEKKGLLDVDDDWYEITEKGIRSLGLPATVRVKKAKTIIKKLYPYYLNMMWNYFPPKISLRWQQKKITIQIVSSGTIVQRHSLQFLFMEMRWNMLSLRSHATMPKNKATCLILNVFVICLFFIHKKNFNEFCYFVYLMLLQNTVQ